MQKVERLSYFSMHPADYMLDTADLSLAEHGAYQLMMLRYYWEGRLLVADKYRGCRSEVDRAAADAVAARFFHIEGDLLFHNRIERELEKIRGYVQHQSYAGTQSGIARAGKGKRAAHKGNGADKGTPPPFVLPDWVIVRTWDAWVKIRPAKARTPESLAAAIEKLEKFRTAGHDGNAIIANSLANGWQGLFPPDQKRGGRPSVAEQNSAAAAEFVARGTRQEKIINDK